MKQKSLLTLVVLATLALVAAWMISERRAPTQDVATTPLFPDLIDQVNSVSHIDVRNAQHHSELELVDTQWRIVNRGGFPARFEAVKQVVVGIAELQILEAKTDVAERYPRLRVEDINAPEAQSLQVTLQGADATILADLIVGKSRTGNAAASNSAALYVRKSGEPQAFLVSGSVSVGAEATRWWDNTVMSIASSRIQRIAIMHSDSSAVMVDRQSPDQQDFRLDAIPAEHEIKSASVITAMAGALSGLSFDDVTAQDKITLTDPTVQTTFTTFDGLHVTALSSSADGITYTQFSARYDATAVLAPQVREDSADEESVPTDEADIEQEAAELNQHFAAWAYVLPEYKLSQLTKRLNDLIQPIAQETETDAAPAAD